MTLLDEAKKVPVMRDKKTRIDGTDEQLELVLALIREEIRPVQFRKVMDMSGGAEISQILRILRWAILNGKLVQPKS